MAKITVAFMREIEALMNNKEISYSRMVEMLNEKAEEPESTAWLTGPVVCLICSHQWIAVRPALVDSLECPNCRNITEADCL